MGKSGKTVLVIMLMLPPLLSACHQGTSENHDPTLRHGKALFELRCANCHAVVRNDARIAPDLSGMAGRLTPDHITQMMREPATFYPGTIMPSVERLTAAERRALVRYVSTLREPAPKEKGFKLVVVRCKELMNRARDLVSRHSN